MHNDQEIEYLTEKLEEMELMGWTLEAEAIRKKLESLKD